MPVTVQGRQRLCSSGCRGGNICFSKPAEKRRRKARAPVGTNRIPVFIRAEPNEVVLRGRGGATKRCAVFAARRKRSQADFATTRCTGQLKTHLISKEVNRLKAEKNALHYVGIAADEAWRCKGEQYPLVEWGVTEAEALQGCYDRGFDFGGLYEIYHRCSCWCCPFQRIDELRKLRVNHPELWARLRRLDNRARAQFGAGPLGQFKKDWSVERLEERFAREEAKPA